MEKTNKIVAIFLSILLFCVIFIAALLNTLRTESFDRDYYRKELEPSLRGAIITSDGMTLASSANSFNIAFDGRNAEDKKLIAKLFALYSGKSEAHILELLGRGTRVFLAKDLTTTEAKNIAHLSRKLDRAGAFKSFVQNGETKRYGLDIVPAENPNRIYLFGDLLQPALGFVQKSSGTGQMGIERFYEVQIKAESDGFVKAQRDASGNMIYNGSIDTSAPQNGFNAVLTINGKLQSDIERALDRAKEQIDALEVIAAVMESGSGRLITLATSNRYDASGITNETLANTRMNAVQYSFEPGSVMKPFVVALLFDEGLNGQYDLVRGYNGRCTIGRETITDVTPREWLSVEDVVIHSSNIGIAQLALNLSAYKLFDGLNSFGFSHPSGVDLPYEATGELPVLSRYRTDIYRATTGYGYGLRVTFMQLIKAYNVFNNGGILVAPRLVEKLIGENAPPLNTQEGIRVIGAASAEKIMNILRKTVVKGSAKQAIVEGVYTAGKTGTAHIARAGSYQNDYHNAFFGFANDSSHRYAIGVLVIDPRNDHYASRTAAPIFAETVELLITHDLLKRE